LKTVSYAVGLAGSFFDAIMGLTVKKVAKLMNAGERGRFFDDAGMYLVIGGKNSANWTRRYELDHRAHWMGLGSARTFTLDEARVRNREVSKLLADGIDPLVKRRAKRAERKAEQMKSRTFKECAEEYIQRHQGKWRSAQHGRQWKYSLERFVYPRIGNLPAAAINKPLVLSVLEQRVTGDTRHPAEGKFWTARTVTADRVRSRIELVLNFASAVGYRPEGIPNPAAWPGLKDILPAAGKRIHHAALPYTELPGFLVELRPREGVSPKALEFTILTAGRSGEALGASWAEIDLAKKVWTIPAERMKGGREHRVPLSPQAIKLLHNLHTEEGNPNLFIGARGEGIFGGALQTVLKRMGRRDVTVHGMRSSFSDWAHDRTAFSSHVIELSLAHAIGSDVEKAYRRTDLFDKRRRLMEDWANFCATPQEAGVITPLRVRV
jgi:integrase